MKTEKVTSWRDFIRELKGIGTVAKWAFKMADAPEARKWLYLRYGGLIALVIVSLIQPAVISYIFAGVVGKNLGEVEKAILILAALVTAERMTVYFIWLAHENLFGPALQKIHRHITEKFLEKSPHQHKNLKGLNHESMAKGKNRLFDLYVEHLPEATEVVALVVTAYIFLWFISPVAGTIMTVLMVFYLSWSLYLNYKVAKVCPIIEEEFTAFERYLASRWKFAERVIVSAKEQDELQELDSRWAKVIEKDRGFWLWHLRQTTGRDFVNVVIELAIIAYGAKLVLNGQWLSVGLLYPLYSWTSVITSNIRRIGQLQRNIIGYLPTLKVMMNTLEVPPDVIDKPHAIPLESNGHLELTFANVSYHYGTANDTGGLIRNVSFTVPAGKRVALVGPTGAGKSTLQYLILRFMDPVSGSILANGKDIRTLTLHSWRKAIAYIPQKPQIFDGTVRDNLLYALSATEQTNWTDDRLRQLMTSLAINFGRRSANENPLDIIVGREGVQLSGGQAQRLAIGAAVIKKPQLMLIDEATSQLDSTTEKALLEGLGELVSGISTLVIAHRLSTVQSANQIIVLVDGSVEASANSFRELHQCSPTFRRLAEDQNLAIL